jgi:transcriptional regulator with XRE-family HTH domain
MQISRTVGENDMEISKVIKDRRSELGITLKEIADKVGVSEATVQRWESGNISTLRHNRIAKLAEVLDVHPAKLMGWNESVISPAEQRMLTTYLLAKESDKAEVRALASAIDRILGLNEHANE